jgi:hypothetical protein
MIDYRPEVLVDRVLRPAFEVLGVGRLQDDRQFPGAEGLIPLEIRQIPTRYLPVPLDQRRGALQ